MASQGLSVLLAKVRMATGERRVSTWRSSSRSTTAMLLMPLSATKT
jgi:hypothetical protein